MGHPSFLFNKYFVIAWYLFSGLSGWSLVYLAIHLKKTSLSWTKRVWGFVERISALVGFFLPLVFGGVLEAPLKKDPNYWVYGEYRWVLAGAIVSPFAVSVLGMLRSLFSFSATKKKLKNREDGVRRRVDVEEEGGGYKVQILDLEVIEDKETHQRVGSGPKFEDEVLEKILFGDIFQAPRKGLFGLKCPACKRKLKNKAQVKRVDSQQDFKEMPSFRIVVDGPMITCEHCGKDLPADFDSFWDVWEKCFDKIGLVLP